MRYVNECGTDVKSVREKWQVVDEEPFSSDRKRMSTLIKDSEGRNLMLIKGASELILESCDKIMSLENGEVKEIDEPAREEIMKAINEYANQSLRTIGVAFSYPDDFDKEKKIKTEFWNVKAEV